MNSDTEETTKVSEIEVNALKETRLAAQEKFVLEKKRHRVAEKCMVPFENLNEDATAKQVFAHVTSIFAGKSMCDRFWNGELITVVKCIALHLPNRGKHMACSSSVATRIFAVTLKSILTPIICASWMWSQGIASKDFSVTFRLEVKLLLSLFDGGNALCVHEPSGRTLEVEYPENIT